MSYEVEKIDNIKLLIPDKFIVFNEKLLESIKSYGVISPVVIAKGVLCDGHKRILACKELGIKNIPVVLVEGEPVELLFELNDREFNINQVAILTKDLTDNQIVNLCKKVGFSSSPQMLFAIKYLASLLDKSPELYGHQLPANIWRELGHLGENIDKYAYDLLMMHGTVSEKRNIAVYLHQAQRRGELPDSIKAEKATDIFPLLQKTAQPRQSEAYEKFEKAIENINLPNNASLKIDPTFSQPGVTLTLSIIRSELEKIEETKKAIQKLFKEVPEL